MCYWCCGLELLSAYTLCRFHRRAQTAVNSQVQLSMRHSNTHRRCYACPSDSTCCRLKSSSAYLPLDAARQDKLRASQTSHRCFMATALLLFLHHSWQTAPAAGLRKGRRRCHQVSAAAEPECRRAAGPHQQRQLRRARHMVSCPKCCTAATPQHVLCGHVATLSLRPVGTSRLLQGSKLPVADVV